MNESLRRVLAFMDGLGDDDYIEVYDKLSGEAKGGRVVAVYQAIIDLNNEFDDKCEFEIMF